MAESGPGPSRESPKTPEKVKRTYHSGERKMIAKVVHACEMEKGNNVLLHPLSHALDRASAYTGASISTIRRIKLKRANDPSQSPETPGKKRTRTKGKVAVDDFDKRVIRDTIQHFYSVEKIVPSLDKLLPVLREKINWKWGRSSLGKTLHSMGFFWRRVQNKRTLLLERADIVDWRTRFIVQMKHFRENGREIFYLDESWIDSNLTVRKCWQRKDVIGVTDWGSTSKRFIVASIGSKNGFIEEAQLIFKAKSTTGDYHGQMNSENFERWFCTKILDNLPPESVIVLDNASYHSRQVEKTPCRYDTKITMVQWLENKGISCDMSMRKEALFKKIKENKPAHKTYVVDEIAAKKGHTVIRLPPYHCDLNPIELAWAKIKRYVREQNISGDMSAENLLKLTKSAFAQVSPSDWEGYCRHVQNLEVEYWTNDGILEMSIDDIIINTSSRSSDESEDLHSSENSDSD